MPPSESGRLRLLWIVALAWLALLGLLLASFAFVGENARPVLLLLYLPRHPWLAPGLLLLPFALRRGRRTLLVPLAAGALVCSSRSWGSSSRTPLPPGPRPASAC